MPATLATITPAELVALTAAERPELGPALAGPNDVLLRVADKAIRHERERRAAAEPEAALAPAPAPAGLDIEAMPGISAGRKETLRQARALGASDKVLAGIASEPRMARKAEISLPGRYGNASRATGWARLGKANTPGVSWGEKEKDSLGHLVFTVDKPGKWEVMSSDGFNREERVKWQVTAYTVGDQVWLGAAKL